MNIKPLLAAISAGLSEVERNRYFWTYLIQSPDGSPYITRTLFPRVLGHRLMLHKIHREDRDRHLHNHPWNTADFLILTGGYVEERLGDDGVTIQKRALLPGMVNRLTNRSFHRIVSIMHDTWTIGLIGERVQDWGFLVDGEIVPHRRYFKHRESGGDA